MKREERLHRLFGGIEDELIEDAAHPHATLYLWLSRIAAIAAAVVLTIGIATGPWWEQSPPPIVDDPTPDSSNTSGTSDVSQESTHTTQTTLGTEDTAGSHVSDDTTTTATTTIGPNTSTTQKITSHNNISKSTTKRTTRKAPQNTTQKAPTTGTAAGKSTTSKHTFSTTTKKTETEYKTSAGTTTTTTLPWSGTAIVDVFPTFHWNAPTYTYVVKKTPLSREAWGAYITDINVTGYDPVTDTTHTIKAKLYYIDGTNNRAAVAIRYEGDTAYYPAVNINYWPSTLGGMVTHLGFLTQLRIGNIRYDYRDAEDNLHQAEYAGLTYEKMAEWLFSDSERPNVYSETPSLDNPIKVSVSLPLLDEHGTLTVSENGYLCADLVSSQNAFYIGEEAAANFIDYVQDHCTVVYDRVKTGD
ncbi:MAG: hypothetical protein IJC33_02315 [Clostridia bacterium]|nr:hypothetical protein [Clostridia bacterium]